MILRTFSEQYIKQLSRGVNPGGWKVATPRFWAGRSWGSQRGRGGSCRGREIL